MSHKYAALRAAAEAATGAHERLSVIPADEIFDISLADATQLDADITALNAFNELANPATTLSLLAEREADKARIAELEKQANINDRLCDRIAELESRKVKLPSLNPQMFNDDVMFGYRKAQKEAVEFCAAAGITLETGV